jgi:hypothetical protein
MTPIEEKAALGRQGDDDLRWTRIGWFDQGRPCDAVVKRATSVLPGKKLPPRWRTDKIEFDTIMWAATASYHTLYINGYPVLRIWTNTQTVMRLDMKDSLLSRVTDLIRDYEQIPAGSRSRREFHSKVYIQRLEELDYILAAIKVKYGLETG